MSEQLPVGTEVIALRQFRGFYHDGELYGNVPAGSTGHVESYFDDGRVLINFGPHGTHSFPDLDGFSVGDSPTSAQIDQLRAQVAALIAKNEALRVECDDNMMASADYADVEIAQLAAERDALAAKLAEAQAELTQARQHLADSMTDWQEAEEDFQRLRTQTWQPVTTATYQDSQRIVAITFHQQTITLLVKSHGLVRVRLRGDHRLCRCVGASE